MPRARPTWPRTRVALSPPSSRRSSGSCWSCVPNSRRSWSAPASRWRWQERAEATERRALREIDRERTLRQKAEQALAELRAELAAVQARAQDAAVVGAEERARLHAERDTLSRQCVEAQRALADGQAVQGSLRAELEAALRRAERAQAEATATRRPGDGQAPGAGDAHQVQAGASLRGRPRARICPPRDLWI
ncbi:hypothetical protein CS8_051640 [Cupriavidus sp. 8B]